MVLFGRYYCKAVKPECYNCKLKDMCNFLNMTHRENIKKAKLENSIEELNLIYKTLKETCSCTKLPGKLVMESIVDEQSDNVAQGKKITESVGTEEEGYQDFLDLQNLHKRLFK